MATYVLVAQDRPRVEHFARQPEDRWLLTIATDLQTSLMLASIGCELPLAEIYDRVEFPVETESE